MKKAIYILIVVVLIAALIPHPIAHASGSTYTLTDGQIFDMVAEGVESGDRIIVPDNVMATIVGDIHTTYHDVAIQCGHLAELTIYNINITNTTTDYPIHFIGLNGALHVQGNNNIQNDDIAIYACYNLIIAGFGSLYAHSVHTTAIGKDNDGLEFGDRSIAILENAKVSAIGADYGILAISSSTPFVGSVLIDSLLYASGGIHDVIGQLSINGGVVLAHDTATHGGMPQEITITEDGQPVPKGTKLELHSDGIFLLDIITQSSLGKIYGKMPLGDHYIEKSIKKTDVFEQELSIQRNLESALVADQKIQVKGTILNEADSPYERMDIALRSDPKYDQTDTAGEFAFTDVPLHDHNIFLTTPTNLWVPLCLHFKRGDTFSFDFTGLNDLVITLPPNVISVDITMIAMSSGLIDVTDVSAYAPSDNPDTGESIH